MNNNKREKENQSWHLHIFAHQFVATRPHTESTDKRKHIRNNPWLHKHTQTPMHTEYEIEIKTCLHTANKPTQRNAQKHTCFFTLVLLLHITDVQSNGTDRAPGTSNTHAHYLAAPRGTHRQFVVVFACRPWSERL